MQIKIHSSPAAAARASTASPASATHAASTSHATTTSASHAAATSHATTTSAAHAAATSAAHASSHSSARDPAVSAFRLELTVLISVQRFPHCCPVETDDLNAAGSQCLRGLGADVTGDEHLDTVISNHLSGLDAGTLGTILVGSIVDEGCGLRFGIKNDKSRCPAKTSLKSTVQGVALGAHSNFHQCSPFAASQLLFNALLKP